MHDEAGEVLLYVRISGLVGNYLPYCVCAKELQAGKFSWSAEIWLINMSANGCPDPVVVV